VNRTFPAIGLAALAALAGASGCGGDSNDASAAREPRDPGTVLKVRALESGSGAHRFNVKRLETKAGSITIDFRNGDKLPHNVRVQTGPKCCFGPQNKDVGGTNTLGEGERGRATLDLKPGRYVFLCSISGHWNGDRGQMRGTLVVN
jgi:plastocyanin